MLLGPGRTLSSIFRQDLPIGHQKYVHLTAKTISWAKRTRCLAIRPSFTALSCLIFDLSANVSDCSMQRIN